MLIAPEHTAIRVALWRALHAELDQRPLVFDDSVGEKIVGEKDWRKRPDMNPDFCRPMRASIVTRARFIEDLLIEEIKKGVTQYVILGAGLDTFAQRHPELGTKIHVFEVDQPGPQAWKEKRLKELNLSIPKWLHFVPVDFEAGESWWEKLEDSGFQKDKAAVVVSTGVSMYLTKEANLEMLQKMSELSIGSTFAMTFMLSLDLLQGKEKASMEFVMNKAKEAGTPFHSLFFPEEIVKMGKEAGLKTSEYVSARELYEHYLAKRTDGLNAGTAEAFLIGKT